MKRLQSSADRRSSQVRCRRAGEKPAGISHQKPEIKAISWLRAAAGEVAPQSATRTRIGIDSPAIASRLCDLRASTSAVRQARPPSRCGPSSGKHPNIRTSHPLALECSDVRLVGQEPRKRVLELRCPVTVPREIGTLSRMNDDGDAYEKAQTSAWRGKDPDPASDALFN